MPQKTMLKKSDELPHERDFATALAKAKENNGSYDCIIGGSVYSFYKNAINLQCFFNHSIWAYDNWYSRFHGC